MLKNRNTALLRGWFIAFLMVIWAVLIVVAMLRIKLVEGDELDEFAQENNFRLATEEAERGNLYASVSYTHLTLPTTPYV